MANRNSPARLIPGEPLLSLLRHDLYETRRTTRRRGATTVADDGTGGETTPCDCPPGPPGPTGPQGPEGPQGPQGDPGVSMLATELVNSGATGTVVWNFGPFAAVPVVTATVISNNPRFVTVNPVNTTSATIRVWDVTGTLVPNVAVRMAAFEAP